MILSDNHLHSSFSGDGKATPVQMVEAAIQRGLKTITFTDHLDLDYPDTPEQFLLDLSIYVPEITELARRYSGDIEILLGLELGLQPHLAPIHESIVTSYPFDYVIGSSHLTHGRDPYFDSYYQGRSEDEAYREYFESILENIHTFHNFDAYGHLDYVVRYGPSKDRFYSYEKFSDIIDVILKALIVEDIALEINTGSFRKGLEHPNPTEDIIKKYMDLGGKKLTVGADAHRPEYVAADYDRLQGVLSGCNVENYCIFRGRRPDFVSL